MTDLAIAAGNVLPAGTAPGVHRLQQRLLWLVGASGAIVFIEPSPYEIAILLAMVVFACTGLRLAPLLIVPIGLWIAIGLGYSIGAIGLFDDPLILTWILTSWYMAITAMFFALLSLEDTAERLDALARGYLVGGLIAALAGIAGYFGLVPGGDDLLTFAGRARGTFKDPNVLGAFLVFPALYALQRIIEGSFWSAMRNGIVFGILSSGDLPGVLPRRLGHFCGRRRADDGADVHHRDLAAGAFPHRGAGRRGGGAGDCRDRNPAVVQFDRGAVQGAREFQSTL